MKKNRTLILGIPLIVILAFFVIYQYGYQTIQADMASVKEEQDIKTKTLEKYVTFISEKPHLEKTIALLKEERKNLDMQLMEGDTTSLAAAALQDKIKGIISGNRGSITSERAGRPELIDKFTIINVSIEAVMPDANALSNTIYSIETSTPYLLVKELDIRVRNFKDPRELMVKFDVSALYAGKYSQITEDISDLEEE